MFKRGFEQRRFRRKEKKRPRFFPQQSHACRTRAERRAVRDPDLTSRKLAPRKDLSPRPVYAERGMQQRCDDRCTRVVSHPTSSRPARTDRTGPHTNARPPAGWQATRKSRGWALVAHLPPPPPPQRMLTERRSACCEGFRTKRRRGIFRVIRAQNPRARRVDWGRAFRRHAVASVKTFFTPHALCHGSR